MNWEEEIEEFKEYLKLERGLTDNSVKAYVTGIEKLTDFLKETDPEIAPETLSVDHMHGFMTWLGEKGISPRTQARIISGIKSFYKNLLLSEKMEEDPTAGMQTPKIGRKLPTVLSVEEINAMEETCDMTRVEGVRNHAIIETLYSCGLRVTELTELKISNLHFEEGYVTVEGKGRKERIVPIGERAKREIKEYVENWRTEQNINDGQEDYVFINKLGDKISRVMIFNIIKEATKAAGIEKIVSPHTLRHSFATHLVDGGANLRAVQQMLGHESIMTTEIYTHLDNTYLKSTLVNHHPYKEE